MQQYDRIATENVCVLVLKDATYNQSNTQTNQSVQLFNARSEKPRSSQLSLPHRITSESLGGGWIAKWVASSGRMRKSRVRFPAAQKCWAQMEFVNIYQFRFRHMLKYACVRFVLINLRHCGQPWRWLVAAHRPC